MRYVSNTEQLEGRKPGSIIYIWRRIEVRKQNHKYKELTAQILFFLHEIILILTSEERKDSRAKRRDQL